MKKSLQRFAMAVLLFMSCQMAFAQTRQVSGTVTDAAGEPLIGVSVLSKGTTQGGITDENGAFNVQAAENATLVFSYIGYDTQEMAVAGQTAINIKMSENASSLNDVVVIGYGTQKKSQLTGAIASISKKEIAELPITNAGQAMQGRIAGVDVSQSGSKPGSVPKILIRGRRSFNAGNDPLYVVDGIPLSAGYEDINPNDIESMEVLKDATSTAIYGSRGANGVVLITTKRGNTKGKTTVTYDTYIGQTEAIDKIKLFSGPEFAEYIRESRRGIVSGSTYKDAAGNAVPSGKSDAFADSKLFEAVELDGIAAGRTTDYQAMILRPGFQQNHVVGVQGGNDKTQFYLSGGYFQDKGISEGLDYTRTSLRANIDHHINDRVRVGLSSYMMYSLQNGDNLNPYNFTLQQNPLGKARDDSGNIIFAPTNDALLTNPLAEIVPGAQIDETKKYRILNSAYLEVKLLDGLTYRSNFGPDFTLGRAGRFVGAQTNARKGGDPQGVSATRFGFNWTLENILNYNKEFGKHNIGVTALHSIQRDNYETNLVSVQGIPAESQSFYNLGNASSVLGVGTNLVQWTLNSYVGRVNYGYDNKYLVTLSVRRDGSSRFGANTKYGNFPGVAVAWNLSNEGFLKSSTWIDQMKLRASYGSVGNQGVFPYQTQGQLSRTAYAWNNTAAYGYRPSTIGNPDLKWETSTTGNLGLDFSFWRGRLSGSLEVYETNTTDLLLSDQLPGSIGFSAVTRNVGATRNKGVELYFNTVNIDRGGDGFKWQSGVTLMKNTEAIVSLYNGTVDDVGNKWFIGKPLSQFFDLKKVGIWQLGEEDKAKSYGSRVGQIKIQDTNGDGKINQDDRVFLGSEIPNWSGGITNRLTFKGIDFSFFVYARIGQQIISGFHQNNNALAGRYQQIKVDYWTPNNPTNEFPQPNKDQEFPVNNTALIYFDGSFVKVRNVSLGYTLPKGLTQKLGVESLRIYTSLQQPYIWSTYRTKYNGVDPETAGQSVNRDITPATKITTVGLNVRF
jgi:TonB-linked SusC/RagA family outer membrane protein